MIDLHRDVLDLFASFAPGVEWRHMRVGECSLRADDRWVDSRVGTWPVFRGRTKRGRTKRDPAKHRADSAKWAKAHPEKAAAKSKRWADANREKVRARARRGRQMKSPANPDGE